MGVTLKQCILRNDFSGSLQDCVFNWKSEKKNIFHQLLSMVSGFKSSNIWMTYIGFSCTHHSSLKRRSPKESFALEGEGSSCLWWCGHQQKVIKSQGLEGRKWWRNGSEILMELFGKLCLRFVYFFFLGGGWVRFAPVVTSGSTKTKNWTGLSLFCDHQNVL